MNERERSAEEDLEECSAALWMPAPVDRKRGTRAVTERDDAERQECDQRKRE